MSKLTAYQSALVEKIDGYVADGTDLPLWNLLEPFTNDPKVKNLANGLLNAFWDVQSDERTYVDYLGQMADAGTKEIAKIAKGYDSSDWFSTYARNAAEYRLSLKAKTEKFMLLVRLFNDYRKEA